jgi:hypothetical protein
MVYKSFIEQLDDLETDQMDCAKSMDLFELSPILVQIENQAKIIDMIERNDDLPEIFIEGATNVQPQSESE